MVWAQTLGLQRSPWGPCKGPYVSKVVGKVNTWVKEVIKDSCKNAQNYTKGIRIISEPKKMGLAKWLAQL